MKPLFIAIALLFALEVTAAGVDGAPATRMSSVTEMLQRKQEHQLREQLVKDGRWDEIRELDEAQVRRQQVQIKQTLTRMNSELAREGSVDTPVNGDGVTSFCAPGAAPGKLPVTLIKPESVSPGSDTRNVR